VLDLLQEINLEMYHPRCVYVLKAMSILKEVTTQLGFVVVYPG